MPTLEIGGKVALPASKSLSNRALVMNALAPVKAELRGLAECDDTRVMQEALRLKEGRIDVGQAGTAMRFLTALLAGTPGTWVLDGSTRMRERPISILVDALNALGGKVEYTGEAGFPPLRIEGRELPGGEAEMAAGVSSQYASALMMAAPVMQRGLKLQLTGRVVSMPYIRMTERMMGEFGVRVEREGEWICIPRQEYRPPRVYEVERDWTAASYFYELLATARGGRICLTGLRRESLQGDAGQAELWERLGVRTRFEEEGAWIERGESGECPEHVEWDFRGMPDLVPSFAVACCLRGVRFRFTGVETLAYKESNRLQALVDELGRAGFCLRAEGGMLCWAGEQGEATGGCDLRTYDDHRLAMAFAPLQLALPGVRIEAPEVVGKSFPRFWEEMEKLTGLEAGFWRKGKKD